MLNLPNAENKYVLSPSKLYSIEKEPETHFFQAIMPTQVLVIKQKIEPSTKYSSTPS